MKVLIVHNRYRSASPGGEDRVVDQESSALSAAGHAVEHFERRSDDIAGRSLVGKAALPFQVVWSEEGRRSLGRTLRVLRPDVVHIHNTFPLVSASALYACRTEAVPVVATVHNYRLVCSSGVLFRDGRPCRACVGKAPLPAVRHGCYRDSSLATLPLATGVVVHRRAWRTMVGAYVFLSAAQRAIHVEDGVPGDRSFVKPNFVPRSDFGPVARQDIVAFAGRLTPEKGIDVLMEAWDRFVGEAGGRPRLRLAVAGGGPLEGAVKEWAAQRPSVEWKGLLPLSECRALLASARAVLVPSQWEETFGLTAVEAMSAGVAPIASALGSFPELITPGVDGALFDASNPSSLAATLQDVEARPGYYEQLGHAARRTYEERFTADRNIAQLVDIYRFAVEHPIAS